MLAETETGIVTAYEIIEEVASTVAIEKRAWVEVVVWVVQWRRKQVGGIGSSFYGGVLFVKAKKPLQDGTENRFENCFVPDVQASGCDVDWPTEVVEVWSLANVVVQTVKVLL